jgi:hypothetical protein
MRIRFQLDPMVTHGIVFQSNKPIIIQGFAPSGKTIHLDFLNVRLRVRALDGRFTFELPAFVLRNEPFSFVVRCGFQTIEITNCLIGDVYLMIGGTEVWERRDSVNTPPFLPESVRILMIPEPWEDMGPVEQNEGWRWSTKELDSAALSALAVRFATRLQVIAKRPVGIVVASRPNADLVSLMDPSIFYRAHQFERMAQEQLRFHREEQMTDGFYTPSSIQQRAGRMFDELFVPASKHGYAAIVFAQDVSDSIEPELVEDALRMTYFGWRKRLNDSSLPIILAQIADCLTNCPSSERHALIREAQRRTLDPKQKIYLATSAVFEQLGSDQSIVSVVLADRLAKVVQEKIHQTGRNLHSPSYFSHSKKNGVVIYTDWNMLPLVSRSNRNLGFSVSYDGLTFEPIHRVQLILNQIVLEGVQNAKEIRYDFTDHPLSDIGSQNGLPLLPFRFQMN